MIVYINLSTSTFCNIDVIHFHFHLSIVNLSFTLSNLTSTFFHLIQLFCILPASFFLKFNSYFTVFTSKTLFYVGTYTAFLLSNFLLQLVLLLLLLLPVFCNPCFYFLSSATFASTSCILQLFCSIFFYFIIIQFSLNSSVHILIIFLYGCLLFTVRSCTAIVLMW